MHYYDVFASPVGPLLATVNGRGEVAGICFLAGRKLADALAYLRMETAVQDSDGQVTGPVRSQLAEYFAGRRRVFHLELAVFGTGFQQRVREELLAIPYGETRHYGQIARALGSPGAARAVGRAAGANRIPIVVPCHRVVGADGSLTGFAGGLQIKAYLLELEGALSTTAGRPAPARRQASSSDRSTG